MLSERALRDLLGSQQEVVVGFQGTYLAVYRSVGKATFHPVNDPAPYQTVGHILNFRGIELCLAELLEFVKIILIGRNGIG